MMARGGTALAAVVLLLGFGAPAQGVNLIIQDGKLVSPEVAQSSPDSAEIFAQGCIGCTRCPANLRAKTCSAAVFTSFDDALQQASGFYYNTCVPDGCTGAFASSPCDLSWISDPTFHPVACAKDIGLIPMPTLSQWALVAMSVVMLVVGTLWLRRRASRGSGERALP